MSYTKPTNTGMAIEFWDLRSCTHAHRLRAPRTPPERGYVTAPLQQRHRASDTPLAPSWKRRAAKARSPSVLEPVLSRTHDCRKTPDLSRGRDGRI
ncbi:hypothetical protein ON010_g7843 [Phytophthora cinnamomi]|nr:hypothetical protein ON010_g7843 [Phytophthora cinnamomi]